MMHGFRRSQPSSSSMQPSNEGSTAAGQTDREGSAPAISLRKKPGPRPKPKDPEIQRTNKKIVREKLEQHKELGRPDPEQCPREECGSDNTKFCYYNNYNVEQPRFYCRACQRFWTKGGKMRTLRVGSGKRKYERSGKVGASDKDAPVTPPVPIAAVVSAVAKRPNAPAVK